MNTIDMKRGQKAIVRSISKGRGIDRKMFEIGIMRGSEIQLLEKHPFRGPMLFQVGPTRIVLGRDVATGLEVDLLNEIINEKKTI